MTYEEPDSQLALIKLEHALRGEARWAGVLAWHSPFRGSSVVGSLMTLSSDVGALSNLHHTFTPPRRLECVKEERMAEVLRLRKVTKSFNFLPQ